MARQDQRRWTRGVQEVRSLLGRLRGARGRLAATGDRPASERSKSERDVREALASLKQTARPLIAEAAQLSARRVRFDPDLEEPARLHVADGDARDPVRWSMTFGPSALSLRGPGRTRRLADGLRHGPLAEARASVRAQREASAEPDLLALMEQRWDWTPSVAKLDQWSGEMLDRIERFLTSFGVPGLEDRFELRALGGAPDLVFEEPTGVAAGFGFGAPGDALGATSAHPGPSFFGGQVPSWTGSTGGRPSFGPSASLPALGRGTGSWPAGGGTSSFSGGGAPGTSSFSGGAAPSTPFAVPVSGGPTIPRATSAPGGGTTWRVAPARGASLPSAPLTAFGVDRPVSSGGFRGRTSGVRDAGATRRMTSGASSTFAAPPTARSAATSGSAATSLGLPTAGRAARGAQRPARPTVSARAAAGAAPVPALPHEPRVRPTPTSMPGTRATSSGVARRVGSAASTGPRVPDHARDRRRGRALGSAAGAMLPDGLPMLPGATAMPGGAAATPTGARPGPGRIRRDRRGSPMLSLPGLASFPERHPFVQHPPTMEDGRLRDDRRAPRSPARPGILLPEALMEGLSRRQPLPPSVPTPHAAAAGEPQVPLAPPAAAAVLPPVTSAVPAIGGPGRMHRIDDRAPRRPVDANFLSRLGQVLATPAALPRSPVSSTTRDRDVRGAERRLPPAIAALSRAGFRPERLPGALLGRLPTDTAAVSDLPPASMPRTNAPRFPLSHHAAPWHTKVAPDDLFGATPRIGPAAGPAIGTLGARAEHFRPLLDPERGRVPAVTRSAPPSIGLTRGAPKAGPRSPLQTIAPAFGDETRFTPRLARQPSLGHRVDAQSGSPRSEAFGVVPGRPPVRPGTRDAEGVSAGLSRTFPEPRPETMSPTVAAAASPGGRAINSRMSPRPPRPVRAGEPAVAASAPLGHAIGPSRQEPRAGVSATPVVEPRPAPVMQFPKTNATTAPRAGAIPNAIAQRATEPRGTPTAAVPGAPVSSDHRPLPGVRPSTPWISEPPSLVAPPGGSSRAAGLPRPSAFLHLPDIAHTGPDGVPSGSGVVAPFLPMLQPGVGHRPWTPRALEPLTLRTAVPPGSADVNHPPVVTSLRAPEMRFVAVGAAASRNAPVTRSDSRFLSPPVETPLDEPEDERDRRHQARVFRAEVGRDHRPVPTPLTGATAAMREERRPRVEIPDLDHLASRVYGRIKQQLAVERERRGFVR